MVSSQQSHGKLVVDSVHGDIHLTPLELAVVDTASFQRLRHLKQLGMAQVTYPNATHTRFAHSVGVLGIMERITSVARAPLNLNDAQVADIRMAGLLHDIGHYPYSHLMERVDKVQLTEEFLSKTKTLNASVAKYPNHEVVGELIVTKQADVVDALGGPDVAERIAALFSRKESSDPQLSKLIHSSLDMDRLDYLLRDGQAAGVPYGTIDLNYLLNNFKASKQGMLGVPQKAIAAVEHFLLARFFMHRSVYYHKTTFGIEQACRHLLKRLRDAGGKYGVPIDGNAIRDLVSGEELGRFTDAFLDAIVENASKDADPVVRSLAQGIRRRRPPKLLRQVDVLKTTNDKAHAGVLFRTICKSNLAQLASSKNIPVGRFLICETPPLMLEQRGAFMNEQQARKLEPEEREELIKIFVSDEEEPKSLIDIPHSIIHICSGHAYQSHRLYFVPSDEDNPLLLEELREEVNSWELDAA